MKKIKLQTRIGTIYGLKIDNGLLAKAIFSSGDINTILSQLSSTYPSLKDDIKNLQNKLSSLNFQLHTHIHIFANEVDFNFIPKDYNEKLKNKDNK